MNMYEYMIAMNESESELTNKKREKEGALIIEILCVIDILKRKVLLLIINRKEEREFK